MNENTFLLSVCREYVYSWVLFIPQSHNFNFVLKGEGLILAPLCDWLCNALELSKSLCAPINQQEEAVT